MQESIDLYNQIISSSKNSKGFQGAYLMTDANSNKALSITVWETEADMLAGESSGGAVQQAVDKLGGVLAGAPEIDHYELSVDMSA